MSYTEKLEELWNSENAQSIGETLREGVNLLYQAKAAEEEVPLDIELDIINTANYAMDYGSTEVQMSHIFDIWKRSMGVLEHSEYSNKIYRLIAIAIQVTFGNLMIDIEQHLSNVKDSLNLVFDLELKTTEDILKFLFEKNHEALSSSSSGSWKIDCLLAEITLFSSLEELGSVEKFQSKYLELNEIVKIIGKENFDEKKIPNSDKFRFIHLMIFNNHPDEKRWINNYNLLMGE